MVATVNVASSNFFFYQIPFIGCRERVKIFSKSEAQKINLEDYYILISVNFHKTPFSGSRRNIENCSARDQGRHPVFLIGLENTNVLDDGEFLFLAKVRQIVNQVFREEVENVSANQRLDGHIVFFIGLYSTNI